MISKLYLGIALILGITLATAFILQASSAIQPCDPGFHREGSSSECVPNPDPSCPTGSIFDGQKCVWTNVDPRCPTDYHYDDSLGYCVTNVIVDPQCPTGYHWDGVRCEQNAVDPWGLKKVYSSQQEREWYMNMNNPTSGGIFYTGQTQGTRAAITQNADGSWRVNGANYPESYRYQVRMIAITPLGQEQWKNIEWTAYVKPIKTFGKQDWMPSDLYNAFILYNRGGIHGGSNPCDGSAMKAGLTLGGTTWFKKEVWHSGGYTNEANVEQSIPPLLTADGTGHYSGGNKWIGIKFMVYNINNNEDVKMEIWLDKNANNVWEKVNEFTDTGNWSANGATFFDPNCKDTSGAVKQRNHVINYAGPWASIRTDNIEWDFKWMSVREINVPGEPISQNPIQLTPYLFELFPGLTEYHGDAD